MFQSTKDPILPQEYATKIKDVSRGQKNEQRQQIGIWSTECQADVLYDLIKVIVGIFMISETKLGQSFREGQFIVDGCHGRIKFDRKSVCSGKT